MNKKILLTFIALFASLLPLQQAAAQTTHAHSASLQWKGINVEAFVDATIYSSNPSVNNLPGNSTERVNVYLYNVGTGRFLIEGGGYGTEGRLFHEDFGRLVQLCKRGHILSGITEETNANLKYFICNIPDVTKGSKWNQYNTYNFTSVMDGGGVHNNKYESYWHFVRVEDGESDTYTYYMYQHHSNKQYQGSHKDYYLGAAYGEWCSDGTNNTKGNGYYVHLDDDRTCWTTAGQSPSTYGANYETSPYENDSLVLVNGDMVPIRELYQWRLVSEEEFKQVMEDETRGLNPNVSSSIPDRDFTRNADEFYTKWVTTPAPSAPQSGEGRYGYTWGYFARNENQAEISKNTARTLLIDDEAWNSPVRLKQQFDDMSDAKYGFMTFEGIGAVSATFTIPRAGWYLIEASAISFGNPAYMYGIAGGVNVGFAELDEDDADSPFAGYSKVVLEHTTADELVARYTDISFPASNQRTKRNKAFNLAIGKVLTNKAADHRRKFWIYVDPDNFELDDIHKTVTLGIRKANATQSEAFTDGGTNYYYDTDWVCIDDIKMMYMGLAPTYLYESEESLAYMLSTESAHDHRFSGSVSLERTMTKNKWNSFSLPIPLTGEQVRYAFGEEAELLELVGVGTLSLNSNVIDFRHVELKPVDPLTIVVEPGKFYLLKPTADPVEGKNPSDELTHFYQLGRNFFSVKPGGEDASYTHYWMNPSVLGNHYAIDSYQDGNPGVAYVSYIKTPSYDSFTIDGEGIYSGSNALPDTLYVPGSTQYTYAVNGGTIWELNRDMPIKGFRGWIKLTNSVATINSEPTSGLRMAIDGIADGEETTGIAEQLVFPVSLPEDTNVYDLFGRRVGTLGMQLPKGIYIVKGKKFYVR